MAKPRYWHTLKSGGTCVIVSVVHILSVSKEATMAQEVRRHFDSLHPIDLYCI